MNQKINYKIQILDDMRYRLTVDLDINTRMMKTVFEQSKKIIKKKLGVKRDIDLNHIYTEDRIELDKKYHKLVMLYFYKVFGKLKKQIEDIDKVRLGEYECKNIYLIKQSKDDSWKIQIVVEGYYAK